jgi:hypothetical protein
VALAPPNSLPPSARPYLIDSRWRIAKFRSEAARFEFQARGFGRGEIEWQVAPNASYLVRVSNGGTPVESLRVAASRQGVLRFTIVHPAIDPVSVEVVREGSAR